jgi:hypothetical protein
MTPWSKSTLYRVAPQEDSPFHKQGGRWVTTESDLLAWVRSGAKPQSKTAAEYPMPKPRRQRGGDLLAIARERRRSMA